jgi:hypothetical protein
MDNVKDGGAGWRIELQKELIDMEICWLDPTHKPIVMGVEDMESRDLRRKLKSAGDFDSVSHAMKVIRSVDLQMVYISDFVVARLDLSVQQCGTFEEIFKANDLLKPIIVHVVQGKEFCPDWLFGTLPHELIFSSIDEIYRYLRHVAHDPVVETFNRWRFFNFDLCRQL